MDIKLKCLGCGHVADGLPRSNVEKSIKKILPAQRGS